MKKLFTLLLALVATTALWAEDFSAGGIYYNILTDKTNEVEVTFRGSYSYSYGDEYSGSVIIPSTVTYSGKTYSVTSIGDEAFASCSRLKSVHIIPNCVTSIGEGAFTGCSELYSVIIGNSVTSIGGGAFWGCSSLTSVTIPNSVTSIGEGAFTYTGIYNNGRIWEDEVLYISNCLIDVHAGSVAATYTIKDGTRVIADNAFDICSRLKSITIPNSVTSIGDEAFSYCSGLTSIESLAETPPTLGSNAFYNVSTSIPVYVPCGSVSAYQSAEGWNAFTNIQCKSNEPSTDLENTHSPSPMTNCQKVIRDGQLIILRDGKTYNAMGQEL